MSYKSKLTGLAPGLVKLAENAVEGRMKANPWIKDIKLKGTELHTSHDGSGKKVITIQMLNETGGRVESIHMEETGEVSVKGTAKGKGTNK
ncbi:hypothetical protein VE04_05021 [Pseudogymnoascus sp. 24MN13]|nr:hypothetical protein VE04_05021 [Pseudogymnoascus sp. 24MN13]